MRLLDKVSIITGSGRSIGYSTARKFGAEGAKVVVCDIDQAAVDSTVKDIVDAGGQAIGFAVDVTKKDQIEAMVQKVLDKWGRIDVLINNAGIIQDGQLAKMTDEQFDRVININLRGTYLCARAVVDTMIAQKSGVIINASSIVGLYGNFGQTNYAASKFAVIGMAKSWAKELGRKHEIDSGTRENNDPAIIHCQVTPPDLCLYQSQPRESFPSSKVRTPDPCAIRTIR